MSDKLYKKKGCERMDFSIVPQPFAQLSFLHLPLHENNSGSAENGHIQPMTATTVHSFLPGS